MWVVMFPLGFLGVGKRDIRVLDFMCFDDKLMVDNGVEAFYVD